MLLGQMHAQMSFSPRSFTNLILIASNAKTWSFLQKFRLIDTAGIRRRAAVASSGSITESLSVNRAFRAIRRSDVVALVIEALACITEQVVLGVLYWNIFYQSMTDTQKVFSHLIFLCFWRITSIQMKPLWGIALFCILAFKLNDIDNKILIWPEI